MRYLPSRNWPGLPPIVLITCEYDDLRASDEDFALLLQKAGVPVEMIQEPGMLHGHLNFDPGLSGTDHSLQIFADALVLV
jgi:acetyl esterase